MLTKQERAIIDKLIAENTQTVEAYLSYLSPKGFSPGGRDYKTMLSLKQACTEANANLNNYLSAITDKERIP